MTLLKRKLFYVLVVAMVLCLVMAFVPFASKTALAEIIEDPTISEGFTIKGAYVQLEAGAEENPDAHSDKFALTFVATLSQEAYNEATKKGEPKFGLLIGPNKAISSVTDYESAILADFREICNVGSPNSGANQAIVFDELGNAEIEAGIVFDESKLPENQLKDAAGFDLVAIPFVTYGSNDNTFIYKDNALNRSAKPIIHESYIRGITFDREKYADDENKPVEIPYKLEEKFVVDVKDSRVYSQKEGEFYYDAKQTCMQMANADRTLTYSNNLLTDTYLSWGFNTSNDSVYVGGVKYTGSNTSRPTSGNGDMVFSHLEDKERYSYGFTVFHNSGDNAGKVETFIFKAPTLIISAGSNSLDYGLVGPYQNSNYVSPFANSVASASDRTLQEEYDGYYILANDVSTSTTQPINVPGITSYGGTAAIDIGGRELKNDGTKGFTGVFDGRGFSIYDGPRNGAYKNAQDKYMFQSGVGLFTWINGGTVKNVSFFNINMYFQPRYGSILAYAITGNSLIENVYIKPLTASLNASKGTSVQYNEGALLAQSVQNSTFRNVIVEHDFMDSKDGDLVAGVNNYQLFRANSTSNNTFDNFISLGNTPIYWFKHKANATITIGVEQMPVIDAEGTTAIAEEAYLLGSYPVLSAQFGDVATYIVNESYGPGDASEEDKLTANISVTFRRSVTTGVKQFSGYRDLAAYVTNPENEAVKTALVNSGFYNVAENGFVTPKHIPITQYASNSMKTGYTFGNRVDDAIVVSFWHCNNSSNSLYTALAVEMVMADEYGKYIVDFSKYSSLLSSSQVFIVYDIDDNLGTNVETFINSTDIASATAKEVPAYDVVFQRIGRKA